MRTRRGSFASGCATFAVRTVRNNDPKTPEPRGTVVNRPWELRTLPLARPHVKASLTVLLVLSNQALRSSNGIPCTPLQAILVPWKGDGPG